MSEISNFEISHKKIDFGTNFVEKYDFEKNFVKFLNSSTLVIKLCEIGASHQPPGWGVLLLGALEG